MRERTPWLVAWAAAWAVTAWLIAATHYSSRDPDSQLYAGISARLVREPAGQWIAPQWWGFWQTEGPYCEHPVGMFVVPAALGRAGYPAEQAAYAITALYQIASLALLTSIAASVLTRRHADALGWILQLLPIAFVFRVRANQEYAVLAGLLFAIHATERARTRSAWTIGMLAGFCVVLLVKGVFAFMVPVACGIWLIARAASRPPGRTYIHAWLALAAMPIAAALVAWGYEAAYVHATGRSFLAIYQSRQLPEDALAAGSPIVRAAYTGSWYLARVLWYAFPWSLAAVALTVSAVRARRRWPWPTLSRTDHPPAPAWQGAWFAIVSAVLLTTVFSLAHRKADRYIFPVYFLIGAAGAGAVLQQSPRTRAFVEHWTRFWTPAVIFVVLVLLTIASSGKLPQFTFWRT